MALLAVAQWEWVAQDESQLSLGAGARVTLLDVENDEWWHVSSDEGQKSGFVPSSWLALEEDTADDTVGGDTAATPLPATDPDVYVTTPTCCRCHAFALLTWPVSSSLQHAGVPRDAVVRR